jgi:uncharacterized Zn finger protein (UPF0148 family)
MDDDTFMDLDALNLGSATCETCGSTNFYNDAGHYFCSLCNTQSQVNKVNHHKPQLTNCYHI